MNWALVSAGSNDPINHVAVWLTILAEGLVIAGFVIGVGSGLLRWQKKKDRVEEEQNRQYISNEVRTQIEGFRTDFKDYFETRISDITNGVKRTVSAVERNTGSSIPDALARLEKRQGTIDDAIGKILNKIEELDSKS
jgi:hypothetical protein